MWPNILLKCSSCRWRSRVLFNFYILNILPVSCLKNHTLFSLARLRHVSFVLSACRASVHKQQREVSSSLRRVQRNPSVCLQVHSVYSLHRETFPDCILILISELSAVLLSTCFKCLLHILLMCLIFHLSMRVWKTMVEITNEEMYENAKKMCVHYDKVIYFCVRKFHVVSTTRLSLPHWTQQLKAG